MDEQPDPPSLRLSPLTAALLIPALCAAVLASLWLGSHARSTDRPTATTSPTAIATPPGPTPWALAWHPEDGGSVDPRTAYGTLAIDAPATPPPHYTATLTADASVPPPERPDPRAGTVQHLRPLDQETVDGVAQRLGSLARSTTQGNEWVWPDAGISFDPATATFRAQLNSRDGALPFTPRDTDSAARAAQAWLLQRGLVEAMAPVAAVQVSRGDLAAFPTWQVTVPHLAGQSDATEITLTVSGTGQASNVVIVHPVVLGAAVYPIVDWEKAWAQVQAGRAHDVDTPGPATTLDLHVDAVRMTSRIVQTRTGPYTIPTWAFTDSTDRTTLYWPALDPAWYTLG